MFAGSMVLHNVTGTKSFLGGGKQNTPLLPSFMYPVYVRLCGACYMCIKVLPS